MQRRLARRSHRSRVVDVLAHIRAVIDAGDHEVRFFRKQAVQRHNHCIRGSALDRPMPRTFRVHHDRPPQRQRLRRPALLRERRYNAHRSEVFQRLLQRAQPFRAISIVIREKNVCHWPRRSPRGLEAWLGAPTLPGW